MAVRHGGPWIILAAFVGLAAGGAVYLFSESLAFTLGVMAAVLAALGFTLNRSGPVAISEGGLVSRPSSLARSAFVYVTVGLLTDVWAGVWFAYLSRHQPPRDTYWYACYGLLLMGFTLFVIGLGLGRIGRAARVAELPPEEVTPAVTAAAQSHGASA